MEDIDYYEIPIYNFPYDVEEDDEETIADNMELRVSRFFVCFSLSIIESIGLTALCRCGIGRRNRARRRACSSENIPLGNRRG